MSEPNGAKAHLQFQQTSDRAIERGDVVLVHLNAYADGYWTDVTRTFVMGVPDERQRDIYIVVLAGLEAGLGAIHAGVRWRRWTQRHGSSSMQEATAKSSSMGWGMGWVQGDLSLGAAGPSCDVERCFASGIVHNVETGTYTNDLGISLAEVVMDREDSVEALTTIPRDLEWSTCDD